MKIVVCVKQVPDATQVKINPENNTLIREGVESIMNPFDTFAVEEGLLLKERYGAEVHVLTMGPPQAREVLVQALSVGADQAWLVSDRAFAGADTLATAYTLAAVIKQKIGDVDLVICGKQAMDGDTAQVGPGIATRLNMAQLTYVSKVREMSADGKKLVAERLLENGKEVVEAQLPCLLTVVKDINKPRTPSLLKIRRAKKAEIPTLTASDLDLDEARLGLEGSPTWVEKIFSPDQRGGGGEILDGPVEESVPALVEKLMNMNIAQ